jgi:hypothetical protein
MSVRCFLLEPTSRIRVYMRVLNLYKYAEDPCPKAVADRACPCHEARVFVDERDWPIIEGHVDDSGIQIAKLLEGDSRWPVVCEACGKAFAEIVGIYSDILTYRVWRAEDGREFSDDRGNPPPGAMRRLWWMEGLEGYGGPDGKVYSVITPDGHDWIMDGPASNGEAFKPGWMRTGTPPLITATPSIQTGKWHGYLRNGELVE